MVHHHPPRIVEAEEVVDAVAAVAVGCEIHLGEALPESRVAVDEAAREPTVHEIKKLVGLDGRGDEVRTRDELDAADVAPVKGYAGEQPFATPPESEHSEDE